MLTQRGWLVPRLTDFGCSLRVTNAFYTAKIFNCDYAGTVTGSLEDFALMLSRSLAGIATAVILLTVVSQGL
jgi:hypothetical protein